MWDIWGLDSGQTCVPRLACAAEGVAGAVTLRPFR